MARLPGAQVNPSFRPAPKSWRPGPDCNVSFPPSLEFGGWMEGDTLQSLGVVSGTPPALGPERNRAQRRRASLPEVPHAQKGLGREPGRSRGQPQISFPTPALGAPAPLRPGLRGNCRSRGRGLPCPGRGQTAAGRVEGVACRFKARNMPGPGRVGGVACHPRGRACHPRGRGLAAGSWPGPAQR